MGPPSRLRRRSLRSRRDPSGGALGPPRLALSLRESWPPWRDGDPFAALAPRPQRRGAGAPAARAFASRSLAAFLSGGPECRPSPHRAKRQWGPPPDYGGSRAPRALPPTPARGAGAPAARARASRSLAALAGRRPLRCSRDANPAAGRWGPGGSRFRFAKARRSWRDGNRLAALAPRKLGVASLPRGASLVGVRLSRRPRTEALTAALAAALRVWRLGARLGWDEVRLTRPILPSAGGGNMRGE